MVNKIDYSHINLIAMVTKVTMFKTSDGNLYENAADANDAEMRINMRREMFKFLKNLDYMDNEAIDMAEMLVKNREKIIYMLK